jgi:hypothetical protein
MEPMKMRSQVRDQERDISKIARTKNCGLKYTTFKVIKSKIK